MPTWFWPALAGWLLAAGVWVTWYAATNPNHRKDHHR